MQNVDQVVLPDSDSGGGMFELVIGVWTGPGDNDIDIVRRLFARVL